MQMRAIAFALHKATDKIGRESARSSEAMGVKVSNLIITNRFGGRGMTAIRRAIASGW